MAIPPPINTTPTIILAIAFLPKSDSFVFLVSTFLFSSKTVSTPSSMESTIPLTLASVSCADNLLSNVIFLFTKLNTTFSNSPCSFTFCSIFAEQFGQFKLFNTKITLLKLVLTLKTVSTPSSIESTIPFTFDNVSSSLNWLSIVIFLFTKLNITFLNSACSFTFCSIFAEQFGQFKLFNNSSTLL